jgi:dienelactone hydrolase
MDQPIGANKFFKQLAYGLAQKGIAVLRYDKRTYADNSAVITSIDEEVIDDAVAAKKVFADQSDFQVSGVYVVGHNFGAMMAPRVMDEGAYDGMVLLGGSPRTFADVLYNQYLVYLEQAGMTEGETESNRQYLDAEYEKCKNVMSLSEEELQMTTIFDMPAYYVKSIAAYPVTEYLETLEKPALILQGSKDIQASVEEDYQAFASYAENNANIEMKLYEGLNNLFMPSTAETASAQEYTTAADVDETVLEDIAAWLKAR